MSFEPTQINVDPSHPAAVGNIPGVHLDVLHVDPGRQGGLARLRKPRHRLGKLVRQPLGDVEQVDLARAAEIGSGNRHGPMLCSRRGGRGKPASRRQGKLCRDRGLARARLAEQEKHPCWLAEELVNAREHPAPAGEMRRPLLDIVPVEFRELHEISRRSGHRDV